MNLIGVVTCTERNRLLYLKVIWFSKLTVHTYTHTLKMKIVERSRYSVTRTKIYPPAKDATGKDWHARLCMYTDRLWRGVWKLEAV